MIPASYLLSALPEPDERPPGGIMAPWLGTRFSADDLYDGDYHTEDERALLPRVRAYPVPSLHGLRIVVPRPAEVSRVLREFLQDHLPGIPWQTNTPPGPLKKYLIVHESLAAPPDETTGQPMSLEVYGAVVSVDGHAVDSEHFEAYWYSARKSLENNVDMPPAVLEVEIRAVNYANFLFPSVGVPFYL